MSEDVDVATLKVHLMMRADSWTELLSGSLVVKGIVLLIDGSRHVYGQKIIFPWAPDHFYFIPPIKYNIYQLYTFTVGHLYFFFGFFSRVNLLTNHTVFLLYFFFLSAISSLFAWICVLSLASISNFFCSSSRYLLFSAYTYYRECYKNSLFSVKIFEVVLKCPFFSSASSWIVANISCNCYRLPLRAES